MIESSDPFRLHHFLTYALSPSSRLRCGTFAALAQVLAACEVLVGICCECSERSIMMGDAEDDVADGGGEPRNCDQCMCCM